jgi:hypothetical protein
MTTTTVEEVEGKIEQAAAKAASNGAAAQLVIPPINAERLLVPIVGTAPLILHKFSEKAKRVMLNNMQGVRQPKEPRNPEQDYMEAFYRHDPTDEYPEGQPGQPVIAFKAATVASARLFPKNVTMTMLKQCLFFTGEFSVREGMQLVRIEGTPRMREDVVRVGNGGTDLRYRPCFNEWSTTLTVTYIRSMLTRESVLSLIDAGGLGVGVGEWRPERNGDSGTFRIDFDKEITVVG